MVELFANSGDPDQTHSAVSDVGLRCLPITRLKVSRVNLDIYPLRKWCNFTMFSLHLSEGWFGPDSSQT